MLEPVIAHWLAEDASNTDVAGLWVAVGAAAISVGSLVVAGLSVRHAKRSADAAGRVARVELARDHRDLAPRADWFNFVTDSSKRVAQNDRFLVGTLPRTYRMHGDLIFEGGSRSPLVVTPGTTLPAGTEIRAWLFEAGKTVAPAEVEMRFFPAISNDPGEPWTCECGEAIAATGHESRGHWVLRLKVEPPPSGPWVAWA
ncbi:hypothetical protein HH310_40840 [Actinoplanes sp. TBRC 11911]|uniref:hypothetical protein n=1 Tax=Actinoplanes sp. TBRC 11911 TaxID=2729386 RepID=UPI00145D2224|nr:hypothetical protein [Actinoplanes sp. TBRC 11911]NMO57505.1 hypothetical protein [Actinoplanes sp. TBRC 11911]